MTSRFLQGIGWSKGAFQWLGDCFDSAQMGNKVLTLLRRHVICSASSMTLLRVARIRFAQDRLQHLKNTTMCMT